MKTESIWSEHKLAAFFFISGGNEYKHCPLSDSEIAGCYAFLLHNKKRSVGGRSSKLLISFAPQGSEKNGF
jgi:hypothetical protein